VKGIRDLTDQISAKAQHALAESRGEYQVEKAAGLPKSELERMIQEMEKRMKEAAKALEFETAAILRDQIYELRTTLAEDDSLKPWERIRIIAGKED
jgi:excinuclease ABC subunit B